MASEFVDKFRFQTACQNAGYENPSQFAASCGLDGPGQRWAQQVWNGSATRKSVETIKLAAATLGVPWESLLRQTPGVRSRRRSQAIVEIRALRDAAREASTSAEARGELTRALAQCEGTGQDAHPVDLAVTRARCLAELAAEQPSAVGRADCWRQAFEVLESVLKDVPDAETTCACASCAIDCARDRLSLLTDSFRRKKLERATRLLLGYDDDDDDAMAILLARQSAVWRYRSRLVPRDVGITYRDRSARCAERACERADIPVVRLERGLARWAHSVDQRSEEEYEALLLKAEEDLRTPTLARFEAGLLSQCRFYRLTFRPVESCEAYARLLASPWRSRICLRESYQYGEAARGLWYRDRDLKNTGTRQHLLASLRAMQNAILAGYQHARIIVAVAHVSAVLEGPDVGCHVLSQLAGADGHIDYSKALEMVADRQYEGPAAEAFALGLANTGVINSLGTFAKDHIQDASLAEVLYREALRVDPHYVPARKNLIELLRRTGGSLSTAEADLLEHQGKSTADMRGQRILRLRWADGDKPTKCSRTLSETGLLADQR